jgi:hypothetical protein
MVHLVAGWGGAGIAAITRSLAYIKAKRGDLTRFAARGAA